MDTVADVLLGAAGISRRTGVQQNRPGGSAKVPAAGVRKNQSRHPETAGTFDESEFQKFPCCNGTGDLHPVRHRAGLRVLAHLAGFR